MTVLNATLPKGYIRSARDAYFKSGLDGRLEVHRFFVRAMRGGPPETYPQFAAEYVEAQLRSKRQQLQPNATVDQTYELTSIVQWAVQFDSIEATHRHLWALADKGEVTLPRNAQTSDPTDYDDEVKRIQRENKQLKEKLRLAEKAEKARGKQRPSGAHAVVDDELPSAAAVVIDGKDLMIDYDKLCGICSSNPKAESRMRALGSPAGPASTWKPPERTVVDDTNPKRSFFNLKSCWKCLKAGGEYRRHKDPRLAKLGAGHDPRFCRDLVSALNEDHDLKKALVEAPQRK